MTARARVTKPGKSSAKAKATVAVPATPAAAAKVPTPPTAHAAPRDELFDSSPDTSEHDSADDDMEDEDDSEGGASDPPAPPIAEAKTATPAKRAQRKVAPKTQGTWPRSPPAGERADPRDVSMAYADDPATETTTSTAIPLERGASYSFVPTNRRLLWTEGVATTIRRMTIDGYRQWMKQRGNPLETPGLPCPLRGSEDIHTYQEFFSWWVKLTKSVDIDRVRHPQTVGDVVKLRQMWFRFTRLYCAGGVERDVELNLHLPENAIPNRPYGSMPAPRNA
jgi:hypothetical protein